jgi:hypothetical protein
MFRRLVLPASSGLKNPLILKYTSLKMEARQFFETPEATQPT